MMNDKIIDQSRVKKDNNNPLYKLLEAYEASQGIEAENQEQHDILKNVENKLNVKLEDYLSLIIDRQDSSGLLGAEIAFYKSRMDEVAKQRDKFDKLTQYLSGKLKEGIKAKFEGKDIDGPPMLQIAKGKATIKKNPGSKLIDEWKDISKIDQHWVKKVVTLEVDTKNIKIHLMNNEKVAGFHLEKSTRLDIK